MNELYAVFNQQAGMRAAADSGAAWEIWLQVELYLALRKLYSAYNNVTVAREVAYPKSQKRVDFGVTAAGLGGWSTYIELKAESPGMYPTTFVAAALDDVYKLQNLPLVASAQRIAASIVTTSDTLNAFNKELTKRKYVNVKLIGIKQPPSKHDVALVMIPC